MRGVGEGPLLERNPYKRGGDMMKLSRRWRYEGKQRLRVVSVSDGQGLNPGMPL